MKGAISSTNQATNFRKPTLAIMFEMKVKKFIHSPVMKWFFDNESSNKVLHDSDSGCVQIVFHYHCLFQIISLNPEWAFRWVLNSFKLVSKYFNIDGLDYKELFLFDLEKNSCSSGWI